MEDAEIVALYWQRSEDAIRETDKKFGVYCGEIARRICGDREDAAECVNDTWLRAWNAMPDARPGILSAFLGRITRNLALDRWRERRRKKRGGGETELALEELGECVPVDNDVQRVVELQELRAAIRAFVSELAESEQLMFTARYFSLLPVAEIARGLGCSESKVKSALARMRRRLQNKLREEGLC